MRSENRKESHFVKAVEAKASFMIALVLVFASSHCPMLAQGAASNQSQEINDENGNAFMEEVAPKPKPTAQPRANLVNIRSAYPKPLTKEQSIIRSSRNQIFMQEVNVQSQASPPKPFIDLSSVGVQVDPHGNIVPLINQGGGPVKPLYSHTHAYEEMPVPTIQSTYNNPLGLPYNIYGQPAPVGTTFVPLTPGTVPFISPSYNPYNGVTSLNPYNPQQYYGYSPYSFYPGRNVGLNLSALGYYRPGYYPGPGYGYSPFVNPAYGLPQQSQFYGSSTSSSLLEPFFRDPNSKNSLLEDALKSGLWGNQAGSASGKVQQGLLGGSYQSTSEQHPTGITSGAPVDLNLDSF
jgi:hypothetical protein